MHCAGHVVKHKQRNCSGATNTRRNNNPCTPPRNANQYNNPGPCPKTICARPPDPCRSISNNNNNSSNENKSCSPGKPSPCVQVDAEQEALRNMFRGATAAPSDSIEKEVDRLMECARMYCEKEKFKLKQFYEEEMVRKKKATINEFRCAMEREVLCPLKRKLCEYEREIYRLQQESGNTNGLQKLSSQKFNQAPNCSEAGTHAELLKLIDEFCQTENGELGDSSKMEALKEKLKLLNGELDDSKKLALQEMNDLAKEDELLAQSRDKVTDLEAENLRLKKIIDDQVIQLDALMPDKETDAFELATLRKRVAELEGERTKSSLEAELVELKKQIEDFQKLKEDAIVRTKSQQSMMEMGVEGETPETLNDGGGGSRKSVVFSEKAAGRKFSGTGSIMSKKSSRRASVSSRKAASAEKLTIEEKIEEVVAPYHAKIDELKGRIKELEDMLVTFTEMESKVKELQGESGKVDELNKRIAQQLAEIERLKNIEPPPCPKPSLTELNKLKLKYGEAEKSVQQLQKERGSMSKTIEALQHKNKDLIKHQEEIKELKEQAKESASVHAKLTDEARKKSEQITLLGIKSENLEAENQEVNKALDELGQKYKDLEKKLAQLEKDKQKLSKDIDDLKIELQNENMNSEKLANELKVKQEEVMKLKDKLSGAENENKTLTKELDEQRKLAEESDKIIKNLTGEVEATKKLVAETQQKLDEEQELARELARKCEEECSMLSKRGQCVLQHEQKSLALAGQLEQDNALIKDRLMQLEDQLDIMNKMENRTRALHSELCDLEKRAGVRTQKLEELRNMEGCDLADFIVSSTCSSSTVTTLAQSAAVISEQSMTNCTLLTAQIAELERKRNRINSELQGKMDTVQTLNNMLDELKKENAKLVQEQAIACKDVRT